MGKVELRKKAKADSDLPAEVHLGGEKGPVLEGLTASWREGELQYFILQFLKRYGYKVWRQNTQGLYDPRSGRFRPSQAKGVADIIGLTKKGRFISIEVKSKSGRVSAEQEQFRIDIVTNGGIAVIVRNAQEFMEFYYDILSKN